MFGNDFDELEKEGLTLLKENELSETKVVFIKKHLKLIRTMKDIETKIEGIEEKLREKNQKKKG